MKDKPTDMLFRIWTTDATDVFALMPGIAGTRDENTCLCYSHFGQHSSADLLYCLQASRPADPYQYASLNRELADRGYVVRVVEEATFQHLIERRKQLHD